jgi:hypothetical protein
MKNYRKFVKQIGGDLDSIHEPNLRKMARDKRRSDGKSHRRDRNDY